MDSLGLRLATPTIGPAAPKPGLPNPVPELFGSPVVGVPKPPELPNPPDVGLPKPLVLEEAPNELESARW